MGQALKWFIPSLAAHAAFLGLLLTLTGCTTISAPVSNPRQVWCDHNQPRRDATSETLRAELDEINAHNSKGEKWCGWRP